MSLTLIPPQQILRLDGCETRRKAEPRRWIGGASELLNWGSKFVEEGRGGWLLSHNVHVQAVFGTSNFWGGFAMNGNGWNGDLGHVLILEKCDR